MKMYHTFLCCCQHAPTEFLVAPSECYGTPITRFESVPWFVSCHLCEHSHRFDHRHYIIYPRNKWPLRLSYFYVRNSTVITLFWQQNVTVILTQKFLSVLCRSWAPISWYMSYKKITVNFTYVITQYTFATTHIYALVNENLDSAQCRYDRQTYMHQARDHDGILMYVMLNGSLTLAHSVNLNIWTCGAMDNASDYGSEDSRFESWQVRFFFFCQ